MLALLIQLLLGGMALERLGKSGAAGDDGRCQQVGRQVGEQPVVDEGEGCVHSEASGFVGYVDELHPPSLITVVGCFGMLSNIFGYDRANPDEVAS